MERKNLGNVGSKRLTFLMSLTAGNMPGGINPETASLHQLREEAEKLKDLNRLTKLENMAIRYYIGRRKPEELTRIDEKKAAMMRSASTMFYDRHSSDSGQRTPAGAILQDHADDFSEIQSVRSTYSTVSTESTFDVGTLELTTPRLPHSVKISMLHVAAGDTRKLLNKKRARNEANRCHLRWQTHVASGMRDDLENAIQVYRQLELEGVSESKVRYALGKLVRGKNHEIQQLMLQRYQMRLEMTELEKKERRWQDLAKELHKVDWDRLRRTLQSHQQELEERTRLWVQGREDAARIGLNVHELQRKVPRALKELARHEQTLKWTRKRADVIVREIPRILTQIAEEEQQLENKRDLLKNKEKPDVLDYVRETAKLPGMERRVEHYKRNIPTRKVTLYNAIKLLMRLDRECHDRYQGPAVPYRLPDDIRDITKRDIVAETIAEFETARKKTAAARRKNRVGSSAPRHVLSQPKQAPTTTPLRPRGSLSYYSIRLTDSQIGAPSFTDEELQELRDSLQMASDLSQPRLSVSQHRPRQMARSSSSSMGLTLPIQVIALSEPLPAE